MVAKVQSSGNLPVYGAIWTIIELEKDIMVLNNVTKLHKILIKSNRLGERISFRMVTFQKQRALTTESIMRYGPLLNLKKKLMSRY